MSDPFEQTDELALGMLNNSLADLALRIKIEAAKKKKMISRVAREEGLEDLADAIDSNLRLALPAPDGPKRRGRPPGSKNRPRHDLGDKYYDDQVADAVEAERNGHEE
jgi:hypothetical protein